MKIRLMKIEDFNKAYCLWKEVGFIEVYSLQMKLANQIEKKEI